MTLTCARRLTQVRVSEYNQLKGQVNAMSRKQTGNLAVRDLSGVVSKCVNPLLDTSLWPVQGCEAV